MWLFLALSAPAATVALLGMMNLSSIDRFSLQRLVAAACVWFFPAYGLLLLTHYFWSVPYSAGWLWTAAFVRDYAGWTVVATLGALIGLRIMRDWSAESMQAGYIMYFGIGFSLLAIGDLLALRSHVTLYEAFLRPAMRVGLLALLPLVLTINARGRNGAWALGAVLPISALAALAALAAEYQRPVFAVLVAVGVVKLCVLPLLVWTPYGTVRPTTRTLVKRLRG